MQDENKPASIKFLAPLVLSNMLNPLNSTMLATAIVTICQVFRQPPGSGALLIVPLYLTSAVGQPLMGRLADLFDARKINTLGLLLILLSAVAGVFAPTFNWLIVSRILLGLGSSAAYPSSIAIVKQKYAALGQEAPGLALSIIAIASQVSLVFGPFLGGLLTETFGWQGIFFINIPIVIIAVVLGQMYVRENTPANKPAAVSFKQLAKELDIAGLGLFSLFLITLLITLLYPTLLFIKIPALVVALVLLIRREWRHHKPFINVRLFVANKAVSTTYLRQAAANFIMYLILYGLPQWMEQSKQLSPAKVGIMMLPLSLTAMIVSLVVSKKGRYNILLIYGTLSVIAASAGLFLLNQQISNWMIIGISILVGLAIGTITIANQATLYAAIPADQAGVTFGLYRTVGYLGAIVAGAGLKHQFKTGATDAGLHQLAFYALIACAVICLFLIPNFIKFNIKQQTFNTKFN